MSEHYIGTILTKPIGRDAIHIALMDVIASELLHPGEFVSFVPDSVTHVKSDDDGIGIIDPYLRTSVKAGDRITMFLLPNTVTSLKHVWTHPSIPDTDPILEEKAKAKKNAVDWITNYAERLDLSYDEIIGAAEGYVYGGDYLCEGGRFEGEYTPDEFWDNFEIVTDTKVKKRGSFFSCSC